MKKCPQCGRGYDLSMSFCLDDGSELLYGPASVGEPRTAILHESAPPSEAATQAQIDLPSPADPADKVRTPKGSKKHIYLSLLVVGLVALGGFLGYRFFASGNKQIESIAVMPFVNESGNADLEYLSDGMTETLIGSLAQLPSLNVKARSSVFRYKGRETDARTIGNDLKVQAILNGRIAQRGDQLMLSLELVDARTENAIWSQQYVRKQTDVLTLQSDVARDVSTRLKSRLSGQEEAKVTKNYTENSEAYQLYLKGRYYWDKRNEESYKVAENAYHQAISLDPNYALAHAGLADCYLFREIGLGRDVAMPKAKEYALKALQIDESLAEAHTTLAFVNSNYDLDFSSGEREFQRAIELKPTYAIAHQFYGALLIATGRTDEALAEMRKAVELEPYAAAINWSLGMGLGFASRYDEAILQLQKTLQLQPGYALAEGNLTGIFIQTGRYDEAMALVQKHLAIPERRDGALSNLAIIYAKTGRDKEARDALATLSMESGSQNNPYSMAKAYAALGDKDKAIEWLDKAVARRSFSVWFLRVDRSFDPLHDDQRYHELLRRTNLE